MILIKGWIRLIFLEGYLKFMKCRLSPLYRSICTIILGCSPILFIHEAYLGGHNIVFKDYWC